MAGLGERLGTRDSTVLGSFLSDNNRFSDILWRAFSSGIKDVLPSDEEERAYFTQRRLSQSVMRDYPDEQTDLLSSGYKNKLNNLALAGLTAFHGSPYRFTKFDETKIGTGEGAQARGHGFYIAENPAVAATYKKNKGHLYKVDFPDKEAARVMDLDVSFENQKPYVQVALKKIFEPLLKKPKIEEIRPGVYGVSIPNIYGGYTWTSAIGKEEAKQLAERDIFKGESGENIRSALGTLIGKQSGFDLLTNSNQGATEMVLRKNGISGFKFLDQESRTVGSGTSNYVVFDPKHLNIMETH